MLTMLIGTLIAFAIACYQAHQYNRERIRYCTLWLESIDVALRLAVEKEKAYWEGFRAGSGISVWDTEESSAA